MIGFSAFALRIFTNKRHSSIKNHQLNPLPSLFALIGLPRLLPVIRSLVKFSLQQIACDSHHIRTCEQERNQTDFTRALDRDSHIHFALIFVRGARPSIKQSL